MTIEERAQKLANMVASLLNYSPALADSNYKAAVEEIAAALKAALNEAHIDCIELQQEINCLRMEPCQLPACVKIRNAADELAKALRNDYISSRLTIDALAAYAEATGIK